MRLSLVFILSLILSTILTLVSIACVITLMRLLVYLTYLAQNYLSYPLTNIAYEISGGRTSIYPDVILNIYRTYNFYYKWFNVPFMPYISIILASLPFLFEAIFMSILSVCVITLYNVYMDMGYILLFCTCISAYFIHGIFHYRTKRVLRRIL